MLELSVFVGVVQGIEMTITIVKFACDKYHVYTAIRHQIAQDAATKVVGASNVVRLKKSQRKINQMGKLFKALSLAVQAVEIASLERADKRQHSQRIKLEAARRERARKEDLADEQRMFEMGFLRDRLCQHYWSPDKLLECIAYALDVKGAAEAAALVRSKDADAESFERHKSLFFYLDIVCPVTTRPFESNLLQSPVYSIDTILWLKEKVKRMVYLNRAVIEYEHVMI